MSVDLRRFEYALEPLLRRRRWQLEALQARLGRVLREIEEAARALSDLRERYRVQTERAARALAERLDPGSYPRLLDWLARLRQEIADAERALADLRARRAEVAAECLAQQHAVDVVERHREESVAEFARDEQARVARDADRDWLSRRSCDGAAFGAEPPHEERAR